LPADQGAIAFTRNNYDAKHTPPTRLELLDVATGAVRQMIRGFDIALPAISPDGRLVAFSQRRGRGGSTEATSGA
jgi:Tol biopolymer transport system component